jgi:hypothetical protein
VRLASVLFRASLAVVVFLLALAVLRWSPIFAEPPFDVRALPLAGPAVLLACAAALTGKERRPWRWRPVAVLFMAFAMALAIVVVLRPPAGLAAEVRDPSGVVGMLDTGPVEVTGTRLRALPSVRRWTFRWSGALRLPRTGTYRFWATGRGRVEVTIDGRPVLDAEGDPLRAGATHALSAGTHHLEVSLHRVGAGPRLRLGWTRPGAIASQDDAIAPRYLGEPSRLFLWRATDVLALGVAGSLAILVFLLPWERPRRPPLPHPVNWNEIGISLAGYAALVALMSWPLVLNLAGSGVVDRPDGRLNVWILAWDVQALLHDPGRLFQAPIFHPLPDALAFSENLLLPAILAAPFILLGGPVLGYNVVLLGSMAVSGLGTQLLVRRVSNDRFAAFVAGAFFAVGAHRWVRLAHLQAEVTLFLPFVLLAFDRFWEKRSLGRALVLGLVLALQGYSSIYLGAIAALFVAVTVLLALLAGLRGRGILRLATGFALGALLLVPLARPYLRMRAFQGMEWSLADVGTYATTLASYAASGTRLYGGITQAHLDPGVFQDTLFPGLVLLVLGIMGLASAPRRYRWVALTASAVAIVVSLGPETTLYRFLYDQLVLLRGVRALSRFSLVPVLALSVLAGFALARRRRLSLLALPLFLFESSNVPLRYGSYEGPSRTARALADGSGSVAFLPLGERDTGVMLDGIAHFRPLLNGDSGFMPRPYSRAMELLNGPSSEEGLRFLRAIGVRHVVEGDRLSEVPSGDAARRVTARLPEVPTLWTRDGAELDLGRPLTIDCLAFEMDDRPWRSRPVIEVSLDGHAWTALEGAASLADATLSLYADPRHALGEVRFSRQSVRYLRLPARLPARPGPVRAGVCHEPGIRSETPLPR